jgi:FKBP-type peptidyl-prolyl cis-trans isomerase
MNTRWLYIPVILLGIELVMAEEPPVLQTQKEKVSYAIGVQGARNLKQQDLDIDVDSLLKGMKDAFSDSKLIMTDEEMRATMLAFQEERKQKQVEALKMIAEKNQKEGEEFLAQNAKKEGVIVLPSGLQYKILQTGTGPIPSSTDTVECHYRGTFIDGTEFDSSYKRGKTATFKTDGQIISGWKEILKLMPIGSKWQVFIPPQFAYGPNGFRNMIEPNKTLIFEIELRAIKAEPETKAPPESKTAPESKIVPGAKTTPAPKTAPAVKTNPAKP